VFLEHYAEEAQEALERATTSHQLEITQLDGKYSRLLDDHRRIQKGYNKMADELQDEEVRVQCACRSLLLLLLSSAMEPAMLRALLLRLRKWAAHLAASPTFVLHLHVVHLRMALLAGGPCICCCCESRIRRRVSHKQALPHSAMCRF
jgi:hypothetical protein